MGNHDVQGVIGPDPATGNMFFWGTPGPAQVDEEGNAVEDSKQLPQGSIDAMAQQQADAANLLVTEFLTAGAARIAALQADRATAIAAVQGAVAAEKARVQGAVAGAKQAVTAKAAAARATIASNAAQARGAVSSGLADTIGLIDGAVQAARGTIEARGAGATGDVATMRSTFTTGVNAAFSSGVAAVQAVGTDYAGRANQQAGARASTFQAQALPKTSGWDNFVDGENFEANKRTARVNAARQVGQGYAEEFTKKAGEVAQGLQGGAQQVITGAGQTFTQADSSISGATSGALQQLEEAAAQARAAAQDFATQRLAAIGTDEASATPGVDAGAQQALGQLDAAGSAGCAGVDQIGNTAVQMLNAGYDAAAQAMTGIVEGVRTSMTGSEPPPADGLSAALAAKRSELDTCEGTAKSLLTAQVENAKQQIAATGQQSVSGVQQAQGSVSAALDQAVAASNASLAANMAAVAQVRQQTVEGANNVTNQVVQQHETAVSGAITGLRGDTQAALSNVNSRLAQYGTDLSGDFGRTLAGMDAKITSEAAAAAAKVQPAWRTFVSILVKIIVAIVVAVAIAALFASGAGILALIVGGFLIGAAGAALTYLTDCALGLQDFSARGLITEMVVGGVGGVISALTAGTAGAAGNAVVALLGKGASVFTQTVVNVAVSTAVSFVANSGTTAIQQMIKDGMSGKPITWESTWTSVKENAGVNLIGAFAGSLGASRAPGGMNAAGLPNLRGGMGVGESLRAIPGGMGNALGGTGFTMAGAGLATVPGMVGFGATTVAGGAAHGAGMNSNENGQKTGAGDIADANAETRAGVGAGVRKELDTAGAAHTAPAPTFDTTRRS